MIYRKEIDGLRAIAVLSVIFFHAGFSFAKGGFIGVDIFFVISGFLMTSIILNEKEKGIFKLKNFWERRIRRIFPMLFFIIFISFVPAFYLLSSKELMFFARSAFHASIAISNIFFSNHTLGYFHTSTDLLPLVHTWTLGVEEQFYIIIPIIFLLFWKFGKKNIFYILLFLASASFFLLFITSNIISKFYLLPYRFWELAIGSLICFIPKMKKSEALTLLGLAIIFISILTLHQVPQNTVPLMIFPCFGTALVILFGNETFTAKILSIKPLSFLGLTSYSAYLLHQPFFAFARIYTNYQLSNFDFIIIILIVFAISYFTWNFIENPFRRKDLFSFKSLVIATICFIILIRVFGILIKSNGGFPERFNFSDQLKESFNSYLVDEKLKNKEVECEFFSFKNNKNACFIKFGDHKKNPNYMFVGNSLSLVFLPILEKLNIVGYFANNYEGQMVLLSKYSYANSLTCGLESDPLCHNFPEITFEFVKKKGIKRLFIIGSWNEMVPESVPYKYITVTTLEEDLEYTIKRYSDIGVHIYIIQQNPFQVKFVALPIVQFYQNKNLTNNLIRNFSIKTEDYNQSQKHVEQIFFKYKNNPNVTFIRFDDILCDEEVCQIGTTNEAYWYDRKHMTIAGSKLLENRFKEFLLQK